MPQSKSSRTESSLVPLRAHFDPDSAMLLIGDARGRILTAIEVPELSAILAPQSQGQRQRRAA